MSYWAHIVDHRAVALGDPGILIIEQDDAEPSLPGQIVVSIGLPANQHLDGAPDYMAAAGWRFDPTAADPREVQTGYLIGEVETVDIPGIHRAGPAGQVTDPIVRQPGPGR